MTKRHLILTVLAAGHLIVVACGAATLLPRPGDSLLDRVVNWYGAMSGGDSGYGFYAPDVGMPSRAVFTLTDAEGRAWTDMLEQGGNREANLRIKCIQLKPGSVADPENLVASWAATMFTRHPDAVRIDVTLEAYYLPTMEEYRQGERPVWEKFSEATFHRHQAESQE